jgi:hypothetical protein
LNQPVFVVRASGEVLRARATIRVVQPPDLARPLVIEDIVIE